MKKKTLIILYLVNISVIILSTVFGTNLKDYLDPLIIVVISLVSSVLSLGYIMEIHAEVFGVFWVRPNTQGRMQRKKRELGPEKFVEFLKKKLKIYLSIAIGTMTLEMLILLIYKLKSWLILPM